MGRFLSLYNVLSNCIGLQETKNCRNGNRVGISIKAQNGVSEEKISK